MISKFMCIMCLCLVSFILLCTQALAGAGPSTNSGGCEDNLRYLGILLGGALVIYVVFLVIYVVFKIVGMIITNVFTQSRRSKDK